MWGSRRCSLLSMLELDAKLPQKPSARTRGNVYLLPGQWYVGQKGELVRTLLGSCVGITLWHPVRKIGGMCHFLLPERLRTSSTVLDGRYGDEAVDLLVREIQKTGVKPEEFEAQLYGGADTMPEESNVKFNVGERNVEKAWALIDQHRFQLMSVDVGGTDPRSISLDLITGAVALRRGGGSTP